MTRVELPDALVDSGVIAILRGGDGTHLEAVSATLIEAGIGCLEITTNTPGCMDAVARLRERYGDRALIGIGTVRTVDDVRRAVDAGARFVVAPTTDADVGRAAAAAGLSWLPGALTPTEIAHAWRLGASAVKVFPAEQAGGPAYLSAVRAPLDDVPLVPTGGVGAHNASEYLRAGAVAVGAGTPLVGDALDSGDVSGIAERARTMLAAVAEARR